MLLPVSPLTAHSPPLRDSRRDIAPGRRAAASRRPRAYGKAVEGEAPGRGLVGRDAELEDLARDLEAAAGGTGAVRLLLGEPGIGKTALVDRFLGVSADAFAINR